MDRTRDLIQLLRFSLADVARSGTSFNAPQKFMDFLGRFMKIARFSKPAPLESRDFPEIVRIFGFRIMENFFPIKRFVRHGLHLLVELIQAPMAYSSLVRYGKRTKRETARPQIFLMNG